MQSISVVVPIYNEELNVTECYRELDGVMSRYGRPYELLFVDDGSQDGTVARLRDAAAGNSSVKIIELRRNFGQTAAMAAGLEHASCDIIVTMDGDLQNDPHEIPRMVETLEKGYDLVAGWRRNRKDAFLNRKLPSMLANGLISKVTGVKLHDYGCTLKAMTKEIAKGIRLYGEMHRFIPALANQLGAKLVEIPVNHRPRRFGTSKYGISRTIRVFLDLLTVTFLLGYSKRPIHLFGPIGLISGGLGMFVIAITIYQRLVQHIPLGNRPLFALAVMLVILGVQFLCFGLLAEVLARTYYESQEKRTYVVRRVIEPGQSAISEESWRRRAAG